MLGCDSRPYKKNKRKIVGTSENILSPQTYNHTTGTQMRKSEKTSNSRNFQQYFMNYRPDDRQTTVRRTDDVHGNG